MKILIPMAGEGSRFLAEGYTFPKPLIDVDGKPMIQRIVENLYFKDSEYIFLVRSEHLKKYSGLIGTLNTITKQRCKIVEVQNLTEGAACTALLAKHYIDCDDDLLIANSDQIIEFKQENFETLKNFSNTSGIIFSFNACHPKWSFIKLDEFGKIIQVAEKNPISDIATCGVYWFKKGSDFVQAAEDMIQKNIRTNNEFYIAPVFNELIGLNNTPILPFYVEKMWGIGTPEDLQYYLSCKK